MKKLIRLAFLAAASLSAETINISVEGQHPADHIYFEGNGSIIIPNGTVTADLSTPGLSFNFTLYNIQDSTNPFYAYATYHIATSDLSDFSATLDENGNPLSISLDTPNMDPNPANTQSSMHVDWTPTAIQPTDFDGGIGISFIVDSVTGGGPQVVPEPVSWALCGLGLVGLWGIKRHVRR